MTREAAIEWINYHIDISDYDEDDDLLTALKMAVKALEKQRAGRWIETDDCDAWRCSECEEYFCLYEGTPQDNEYYYCPCCGAKMEEVK